LSHIFVKTNNGLRYTENSICWKRVAGRTGVSRSGEIAGVPRVFPGEILASLSRNSRLEVSFAWTVIRQPREIKIIGSSHCPKDWVLSHGW